MEAEKPIAFLDSGIGGLTVLRETLKLLPDEKYIYYADRENIPYGTKPKKVVKKLIFNAVSFLSSMDIKLLVVACNTATSVAIKDLRKAYSFPIVGMEPAVKVALQRESDKKVLVMATTLTLREEKLKNLIRMYDKSHRVDKFPLDGLVGFAERMEFNSVAVREFLKEKLAKVNLEEYDTIVLGCTHFIYFKSIFKELLGEKIQIVDGNEGTARNINKILTERNLINKNGGGKVTFFVSGKRDASLSVLWESLLKGNIP